MSLYLFSFYSKLTTLILNKKKKRPNNKNKKNLNSKVNLEFRTPSISKLTTLILNFDACPILVWVFFTL